MSSNAVPGTEPTGRAPGSTGSAGTGLSNVDTAELSSDELLALAEELEQRTRDVPARLAAITGTATGPHGIRVVVSLAGQLTDLDLGDACRRLGAAELTAVLRDLIWDATDRAIAAGVEVVAPIAGPELAGELARLTAPPPRPEPTPATPAAPARPARPPRPDDEDDFSAQTFALRD
ncbi:Rossmann-fold NAD(P)-binding domain-containing protein [Actinokineospora bangkokensis]|uniref:YbaB/EbfC DNA-binding family protein n=1 Tax=Actinokineospora bangkokensis TaxID=1193682 RepID=A0A1Q9LT11_9PSEU|nr:hypothetical protein [Actinokineospora bangkokensis]OLR95149.1 hypothetical protein BJP25_07565 [Actinokineospora bangkokensis]